MIEIIGEVGVNHGGDVGLAKELIHWADWAGADWVKFQAWSKGRFPDIEHLRLTKQELADTKMQADHLGIKWLCTAFDKESIDFLKDIGQTVWKVPSGMVTNAEYLQWICDAEPERVILSTGMCTGPEENGAVTALLRGGCRRIDVLHCVTAYPAPFNELNLSVIGAMLYDGYSDHSGSWLPCVAAAAMGANILEAHIKPYGRIDGPDMAASLDPDGFSRMVATARMVETMLGDGKKSPSRSEQIVRDAIRQRMEATA